jgi:transposase
MLLPDPKCLRLDRCVMEQQSICLVVTTSQPSAPCPGCHQPSQRVHSRYRRTLADLPWQGSTVRLVPSAIITPLLLRLLLAVVGI